MRDTLKLMAICEAVLSPVRVEEYYDSLDNYLNQFGMSIGENLNNPDLPYNNPAQKGLYMQNFQVGKIERLIKNGVLILEHIKSYNKGQDLVRKIYPHDKEFAKSKGLQVQSELVNPYTQKSFMDTFSDWNVKKIGKNKYIATL